MKRFSILVAVVLAVGMTEAFAEAPSARKALDLANQRVTDGARGNVLWMEGTISDLNLRPRQWEITFYDPERLNAGTMVRVKDGQVVRVGGAVRLFDDARWKRFGRNFSGYNLEEIINLNRLRFDSDAIVAKVITHNRLADYQVVGVQLILRKPSDGDVAPTWRVRVLARPKTEGARDRWVGNLTYHAESGELLRDDLAIK